MHIFFYKLYTYIRKRRFLVFGVGLLFLVLLGYMASNIKFEEDITQLIPSNEKSETLKKILDNVHFSDKIVVHISASDASNADSLVAYAKEFLDSVQTNAAPFIAKIQGKVEAEGMLEMYDFINAHLPLFLNAEDYKVIENRLHADSIADRVEVGYKVLVSPAGMVAKKYMIKDPLQISNLGLEKLKQLQLGSNFELYRNFLMTKDHKSLLLFITPALPANETDQNTAFVEILKNTVHHLNQKYSPAKASLFGSTLYAVANANQIKQDIQLTVSIAMGVLFLILIVFYRNIFVPIILFVPTIIGALLALAFLYLLKGQISAISLGIGAILLGITLDYSLHILTHYRNSASVKQLFKDVSFPVIMSGLTTAVAFICLLFVKSEALRDLGIFAAISVLGSNVAALIIIPQLFKVNPSKKPSRKTLIDGIASYSFHKNRILLLFLGLIVFVGLFFFNDVTFNNDLSSLNYQPEELKLVEKELTEITNQDAKSIYMVSYGESIDEALNANHLLFDQLKEEKNNGGIIEFSSIGGIVLSTETQLEKIAQWNEFWTAQKREFVTEELTSEGLAIGYKENAFQPFYELLEKDFRPIGLMDYEAVPNLFLEEFVAGKEGFSTVVSVVKIDPKESDAFAQIFKNEENIITIDREKLNEGFLGSLKNDFNSLIDYSAIAVFLILFLFYRNLELSLLTFLPIILTWIIVLAVMDLFNSQFNIFNIMIATFIFGLGVDYSIFTTKGLRNKYEFGIDGLAPFRTSIILSVITTLLGIGTLILAKHPALKSIAAVSILGIVSAALVSFVIQPFLFDLFIGNRAKKGLSPLRLRQTLHAIFSFLYFGLGAFLLSSFSAIFLPLFPGKKEKKMLFFHRVLSTFMKSVLYTNPFVKKRVINAYGENFDKQCIMIANHTSFLDILTVGMLHPKLIYLVNDWVYDSPVFGKAVKLAGFYPVSSGIENGVEHLKEKVREGYSLIAFPEGSRSKTHKIKRFHKGAFYLAEQLQLDILPVLIHGNAHVLPKGDFVIHDGELTVEILERISPQTLDFGTTTSEKTKNISRFFRNKFAELQREIETVEYCKKVLLNNYRYKTCFWKIKKEYDAQSQVFLKIPEFLEDTDRLLQFGSKKGLGTYFFGLRKPRVKITGMEEDVKDLQIAQNCYASFRENVSFVPSVSLEAQIFNVFLISGKTSFPYETQKDYIKLHVEKIIIIQKDFEYQWVLSLGFEIAHEGAGLTVLKKLK